MFERVKKIFANIQNFDLKFKQSPEIIYNQKSSYLQNIGAIYEALSNNLRYGSSLIKNIIDFRKSWIYSSNATIKADSELIDYMTNELNINALFDKLVTLGEIEGRWLVRIIPENNKIFLKIISIRDINYEVFYDSSLEVSSIKFDEKNILTEKDYFVFANTSGVYHNNNTPSNVSYVINYIQNIDKALETLRTLNHVIGVNTILFKTKDWTDAQRLSNIIRGKQSDQNNPYDDSNRKWKIGDGLVAPADVQIINVARDSIESIKDEIITNLQIVSGHTGVPIHLLGFPEMLSNRATAQEMAESIVNKIQVERNENKRKFEELIKKIAIVSNKHFGTAYDLACNITIPPTSLTERHVTIDSYLKLYENGIITKRTLREMIPDVDPDLEELREIEEQNKLQEKISTAIREVNNQYE